MIVLLSFKRNYWVSNPNYGFGIAAAAPLLDASGSAVEID
jgi:hypothetical protein